MTENVTNELLLETLKAIQSKLTKVADDIADLKTDMRGVKELIASKNRQTPGGGGAPVLR